MQFEKKPQVYILHAFKWLWTENTNWEQYDIDKEKMQDSILKQELVETLILIFQLSYILMRLLL